MKMPNRGPLPGLVHQPPLAHENATAVGILIGLLLGLIWLVWL
jgi:hypothetical protein